MNNNGNVHVRAGGAATVHEKYTGFKDMGSVATFGALGQWKVFVPAAATRRWTIGS